MFTPRRLFSFYILPKPSFKLLLPILYFYKKFGCCKSRLEPWNNVFTLCYIKKTTKASNEYIYCVSQSESKRTSSFKHLNYSNNRSSKAVSQLNGTSCVIVYLRQHYYLWVYSYESHVKHWHETSLDSKIWISLNYTTCIFSMRNKLVTFKC